MSDLKLITGLLIIGLLLGSGGTYFILNQKTNRAITTLEERVNRLQDQYNNFYDEYENLTSSYNTLEVNYDELRYNYTELKEKYNELKQLCIQEDHIIDDFSSDKGYWRYQGTTYRDNINNYLVLTKAVSESWGHLWLKSPIYSPFNVTFRYKAGGGSGADGLVVLVYQEKIIDPDSLSAQKTNVAGAVLTGRFETKGYGIEFDNYKNEWDPSSNHIALRNQHHSHLIYYNSPCTEDHEWHNVSIEVELTYVRVSLDSDEIIYWQGILNNTHSTFGFGAACGADNNWHIIDDVEIIIG